MKPNQLKPPPLIRPTRAPSRSGYSAWPLASLLCCFFWPLSVSAAPAVAPPAAAEPAQAPDAAAPTVSLALDLYQKGQFQEAATQGLSDLLLEPWNHELRFIVADSLQRIGQQDQAIMQFEALDGTPFADSAAIRLNALRGGAPAALTRAPSRPPEGIQLAAAAPAYQYVIPETPPAPVKTRDKPVSTLRGKVVFPKRSPHLQRLYDLAAKGEYETVGVQGLALLSRERVDDETRLLIANSLAWSGHLDEATAQYQAILKGQFLPDAGVGLANVYRWRGRDDEALPLYRAVLAQDPKHAAALEGLNLAQREIRPRTSVTLGGSSDSSDATRRSVAVNQRWRDSGGKNIFEVETAGVNDKILDTRSNERDFTLRYQSLSVPFQPKFELSAEGNPERRLFGGVSLYFGGGQNTLEIGHVNWGKLATNAKALQGGLSANHIGAAAVIEGAYGQFSGRFDYYDISDDNSIVSTGLRYVPVWRPLGSHIKLFTGTETRDARKASVNNAYWSPVSGFGTLYAGLLGEWGGADWNLFGSGQIGTRIYGEAGTNWSLSAGGKRWLGNDFALGLTLWRLASTRDNADYRAKAVTMSLEKLWK